MNFIEAINSYFINWSDFKSRSSRSEYWWAALFVAIANPIAVFIIKFSITGLIYTAESTGVVVEILVGFTTFFIQVFIIIAGTALTVRRLHDVNESGWWYLIIFTIIGIIPLLVWFCSKGTEGENRFGKDTNESISDEATLSVAHEEHARGDNHSTLWENQVTSSVVCEELAQGIKQDDLWKKSQAQCSGDETLVKLVYIKLRVEQLREKAQRHVASIIEVDRQLKSETELELRKKEALEQARRDQQEKGSLLEKEKEAITFLQGRGFSLKKNRRGVNEFYWRIEKDGFFRHEAKSVQELYAYAEKIGL